MNVFISPLPKNRSFGGSIFSTCLESAIKKLDTTISFRLAGDVKKHNKFISATYNYFRFVKNPYIKFINSIADQHPIFWIDTMNLAWLAEIIRKSKPKAKIIVISHNDEIQYWINRNDRSFITKFIFTYRHRYTENIAIKYANVITHVTSADCDSFKYRHLSNWDSKKNCILPISTPEPNVAYSELLVSKDRWVFVGSDFFGNRMAIKHLIKFVKVNEVSVLIAGGLCNSNEAKDSGLDLYGQFENSADVYRNVRGAIVLVEDGSGMKLKVAEALSYGLPVIVSQHASSGYEKAIEVGVVSILESNKIPSEFLNNLPSPQLCKEIYVRYYSEQSLYKNIFEIIDSIS